MISFVFPLIRLSKALRLSFQDHEFRALAFLILLLQISGTIFYTQEEGWSIVDALYFCVMTMSTVGYGDLAPTSDISKIFTIIFSILSIGLFVSAISKLAANILKIKFRGS